MSFSCQCYTLVIKPIKKISIKLVTEVTPETTKISADVLETNAEKIVHEMDYI